jgi:hypothetical protein
MIYFKDLNGKSHDVFYKPSQLSPEFFSILTSYRKIDQGRSLTPYSTKNTHKQPIENRPLYMLHDTSFIHIKILSILAD